MTAAHPLPPAADDLDVFPIDDAYMATLPAEERAAIEEVEASLAAGTLQTFSDAEVMAELERRRPPADG
jgi:hypothetical protein